ncbi:MAG: hypothetical protein JXD22_02295 [Sedimentisphaerales bacterium]|nr:hypothetical protein [Sedimentisphaerales bacterium]
MIVLSNEEYADKVDEIASSASPFKPGAYYDPDGDCIEFLTEPHDFYAERIDDLVTVYYSRETNEIIGSLIKGVSSLRKKLLDKYPGFIVEVQDGKVHLAHLFRARLWSEAPAHRQRNKVIIRTYQKLADCAEEVDASADLCLA